MNIKYIQYTLLATPVNHKVNFKQVLMHIYAGTGGGSAACWTEYMNKNIG